MLPTAILRPLLVVLQIAVECAVCSRWGSYLQDSRCDFICPLPTHLIPRYASMECLANMLLMDAYMELITHMNVYSLKRQYRYSVK